MNQDDHGVLAGGREVGQHLVERLRHIVAALHQAFDAIDDHDWGTTEK